MSYVDKEGVARNLLGRRLENFELGKASTEGKEPPPFFIVGGDKDFMSHAEAVLRRDSLKEEGYEVVEKRAERGGNSARVYVPKRWIGKKVKVVLVEE